MLDIVSAYGVQLAILDHSNGTCNQPRGDTALDASNGCICCCLDRGDNILILMRYCRLQIEGKIPAGSKGDSESRSLQKADVAQEGETP